MAKDADANDRKKLRARIAELDGGAAPFPWIVSRLAKGALVAVGTTKHD